METVLVDTSFLVALLCRRDVHHERARELYEELKKKYRLLFTDIVLGETVTVLMRRSREWKFPFTETVDTLRRMVPEPAQFAYYLAWKFWEVWNLAVESEGRLTFNDALLVIGCREEGIGGIVSFDRGFEGYLEVYVGSKDL